MAEYPPTLAHNTILGRVSAGVGPAEAIPFAGIFSGFGFAPLATTDNAIVRWDGVAGATIQNSLVTIDDSGNITLSGNVGLIFGAGITSFTGATSYRFSADILPTAADGAALGSAALPLSDLFLATGGIINIGNGNATGTHATDSLLWGVGGQNILEFAKNAAGAGTYLRLFAGNAAGFQNAEFDVVSSQTAAGVSFRMKGDWPFVIHAPADQSASAKMAIYESEANGTNRMVWQAATSIATDFTLVWPSAVPAVSDTPLVCSSGGVLSFGNNTSVIGSAQIQSGTGIPAGGTAGAGYKFSSTSNFGVFFGSGVPTLAAAKGSLYLRSDGTTNITRAYINTDGGTTWTPVNTVG